MRNFDFGTGMDAIAKIVNGEESEPLFGLDDNDLKQFSTALKKLIEICKFFKSYCGFG